MPPELRVPVQTRDAIHRRVGKLLDRLLIDACRQEGRAAVDAEAHGGLAAALRSFWESGTVELSGSKEATSAFSEIWTYADGKRISHTLGK